MQVRFKTVRLEKLYPLRISRGTSTGSNNLFVKVQEGAHEGIGECAPGTGFDDTLAETAQGQLAVLIGDGLAGRSIHQVYSEGVRQGVDPAALAALDVALWDLTAKQARMPLYRLFGLGKATVETSVTIGINPVDVILDRVPHLLEDNGARALKIKLGSPDGIEADQASYLAAREAAAPFGAKLRIDANGGWSLGDAKKMVAWLALHECDYVEQPMKAGEEDQLPELFAQRPLPIFLDESLKTSRDIARFADRCDGVNLKLMKTGGLTEALRLVATARAHGLGTMIGCMGESSVAIGAGASIGALFDHIDLDSHLNLKPDPATGLEMAEGVVTPRSVPGHGVSLKEDF